MTAEKRELTFDQVANAVAQEIERLRSRNLPEETKLSVLRGMLLSFGGFKVSDYEKDVRGCYDN